MPGGHSIPVSEMRIVESKVLTACVGMVFLLMAMLGSHRLTGEVVTTSVKKCNRPGTYRLIRQQHQNQRMYDS